MKCKSLSHVQLFAISWTTKSMEFSRPEYLSLLQRSSQPRSPTLQAHSVPAELQGKPKNTGVGSLSLLQRIFPTQESNWGLLHCRRILYQLSYQGSHVTRGGDNATDAGCCSYKQTRTLCENLEFSFCPESMGKISEDFVKS